MLILRADTCWLVCFRAPDVYQTASERSDVQWRNEFHNSLRSYLCKRSKMAHGCDTCLEGWTDVSGLTNDYFLPRSLETVFMTSSEIYEVNLEFCITVMPFRLFRLFLRVHCDSVNYVNLTPIPFRAKYWNSMHQFNAEFLKRRKVFKHRC